MVRRRPATHTAAGLIAGRRVHGSNADTVKTEGDALTEPVELTSWRPAFERRVLAAQSRSLRGIVVRADLDRECTLGDGIQERRGPEVARDARAPAEADHACTREDNRVIWRVRRVELCYASVSARGKPPLYEWDKYTHRLPRCQCSHVKRG